MGERFFWWLYLMIGIGFFWLRYLERYVSIWGALIVSLALLPVSLKYGLDPLRKLIAILRKKLRPLD